MFKYIANSFTTKMIKSNQKIHLTTSQVTTEEVIAHKEECISAVGHRNIADALGVQTNRMSIILEKGDILYVVRNNTKDYSKLDCMKIVAS